MQFKEDGQLVTMSVEQQLDHSQNSQENSSDEEGEFSDGSCGEQDDYDTDQSYDSVKILHLTDKQREARINKLDAEMLEKMAQIHQLMYDGGLKQSTQFIEDNFRINEEGVEPIRTVRRNSEVLGSRTQTSGRDSANQCRKSMPIYKSNLPGNEETGMTVRFRNTNVNHNPDYNMVELSKSVETIYKNAVEKRVSSSSDECVDISDETLALIPDADFLPDYEDDVMPSTSQQMDQQRITTP